MMFCTLIEVVDMQYDIFIKIGGLDTKESEYHLMKFYYNTHKTWGRKGGRERGWERKKERRGRKGGCEGFESDSNGINIYQC
jgi:hypothetical protein